MDLRGGRQGVMADGSNIQLALFRRLPHSHLLLPGTIGTAIHIVCSLEHFNAMHVTSLFCGV